MNQNIWGPHLWFSLHTISFNYPLNPTQEERNNFKNFFLNLQEVIPCSICKKNYIRHLKEHPIDNFLNNKKSLVYWVIDMHNMVNGEIGKKILPLIRKEIRQLTVTNAGYYVVYLPSYSDKKIIKRLEKFPEKKWVVFSKKSSKAYQVNNISIEC